jgi:hypothetical protein
MTSWRPIAAIPPELKDGRPVLALIPCYGHYNEIGKLRGYLHAIVSCKYGQWNETGVGKREPAYFMPLPAPPSEDKTT